MKPVKRALTSFTMKPLDLFVYGSESQLINMSSIKIQPRSKMEAVSKTSQPAYLIDDVPVYRRADGLYELTRFLQDASRIKKVKRKTWKLFKRTNMFKLRIGTQMEEDEDGCGYGNFNLLEYCARYASETLARFIDERGAYNLQATWEDLPRMKIFSEIESDDNEVEDVLDSWPNDIEFPVPAFDSVAYIDEQIKHFQKESDLYNEQMKHFQKQKEIVDAKLGLYKRMRLQLKR